MVACNLVAVGNATVPASGRAASGQSSSATWNGHIAVMMTGCEARATAVLPAGAN